MGKCGDDVREWFTPNKLQNVFICFFCFSFSLSHVVETYLLYHNDADGVSCVFFVGVRAKIQIRDTD